METILGASITGRTQHISLYHLRLYVNPSDPNARQFCLHDQRFASRPTHCRFDRLGIDLNVLCQEGD